MCDKVCQFYFKTFHRRQAYLSRMIFITFLIVSTSANEFQEIVLVHRFQNMHFIEGTLLKACRCYRHGRLLRKWFLYVGLWTYKKRLRHVFWLLETNFLTDKILRIFMTEPKTNLIFVTFITSTESCSGLDWSYIWQRVCFTLKTYVVSCKYVREWWYKVSQTITATHFR